MPNSFFPRSRIRFIIIGFLTIALFIFIASAGAIFAQTPQTVILPNPLGDGVDSYILIARFIRGFIGFMGAIALVNFMIAGIGIITSSGNSEKLKKHKDSLLWTVIGIALILGAYALVAFVLDTLSGNIIS